MEYLKLVLGLIVTAVFIWLLWRNRNRTGVVHTWFAVETIAGIVAGVYLVFTSIHALLIH